LLQLLKAKKERGLGGQKIPQEVIFGWLKENGKYFTEL
jgi:hypothetical protein